MLHQLTRASAGCVLRMDAKTLNGDNGYIKYANFTVDNETKGYRIKLGKYSGTGNAFDHTGVYTVPQSPSVQGFVESLPVHTLV